uniref:NAD(P)/FAD-dependent oxidoreductase n=1 Tax=Robertkochia flava TaxID=3447986 RepID=UPI001CCC5DC0|nr:FAD-dependent oxidoreductase [Robertkochia marina]
MPLAFVNHSVSSGFSYWEIREFFDEPDFVVVGAGIVGLNCALSLRERHPKARILVLERGLLPQGASTKNAGFACFGSLSELLDDMNTQTEDEMLALVEKRYQGIQLLRKNLGDKAIGYKPHGGYEVFLKGDPEFFMACLEHRKRVNKILKPLFRKKVFEVVPNTFGFEGVQDYLMKNRYEGQLNTGKMMLALQSKCIKKEIRILFGVSLEDFTDLNGKVAVKTSLREFTCGKLYLATNGFASSVLGDSVSPARAQVLITKPIKKLKIKGSFHIDRGYYYFRNINDRILLGGGRNLDPLGEKTAEFGMTPLIQGKLEQLLKEVILPGTPFEIDTRWSGIMGVGTSKVPVLKSLSDNVACGVRLGGMGVAIGSQTGKELSRIF